MDPFVFHNPTYFVFGPEAENKAGESLKRFGLSRVLIVYGQGSAVRSGLLKRVQDALSRQGIAYWEMGGIKPNPLSTPVHEGIALARREGCDAVLGLGGASALDTAKAIAIGAGYAGDFWDFYAGRAKPQQALAIVAVPTIAAAGSESSNSSVITNDATSLKRGVRSELIRPKIALMNPELTYTVPNEQKAYGIADMMAHIFERYFTNTREVGLTDELCEGVLRQIIAAGPAALQNGRDYAAHADLMWAGALAHNDTLSTGRQQDWASHGMAHGVSGHFDAPHGGVLAVLFPCFMEHVLPHDPQRMARFATKVMGAAQEAAPEQAAREGIRRLRAFYASLGLPKSLAAYGVGKKDIEMLVNETSYLNAGKLGFYMPLDKEDVRSIYTCALG